MLAERKPPKANNSMFEKLKTFVSHNWKTLIKVGFSIFLLYWLIFFLTPKLQMSELDRYKLDNLDNTIKEIYKEQKKLDSAIVEYNKKVTEIDNHIEKIKGQKTIIKEIYHEEINRAGNYTEPQLDSFFSTRYKY